MCNYKQLARQINLRKNEYRCEPKQISKNSHFLLDKNILLLSLIHIIKLFRNFDYKVRLIINIIYIYVNYICKLYMRDNLYKGGGKPYNASEENLNRFYGHEDEETKVSNNDKKGSDQDMDGSDTKIKVSEPKIEKYDHQMEKYMNPIYGLVYCEIGYVPNIFYLRQSNFTIDNVPQNHVDIIRNTCKQEPGSTVIKPTNNIMANVVTLTDIGHYIAIKYVNMIAASDDAKIVILNNNKYVPGRLYINNPNYNKNKELQQKWSSVITSISKFNRYIPLTDNDIFAFHMILFCLWWKVGNNDGFDYYYKGIQDVFDIVNHCFPPNTKSPATPKKPLIIKEKQAPIVLNKTPKPRKNTRSSDSSSNSSTSIFTRSSNSSSDSSSNSSSNSSTDTPLSFEQIVLGITRIDFPLYDQEKSLHFCKETKEQTYADCGETTVRNIINILCFNGTNFDLSLLKEKEGKTDVSTESKSTISELIKYYTDFNTFELQSKITPDSYTYIKNLNARDAWSKLIIENAQYNMRFSKQCETADAPYGYDIDSGKSKDGEKSNLLQMLQNLLPGIKIWEDLKNINITDVDITNLNENGFGKVYIFKSSLKFTVHLQEEHFYVSLSEKTTNQKGYSHIKKTHQTYFLDILYKNFIDKHREYIRNTRKHADNIERYNSDERKTQEEQKIKDYTKEFLKFILNYNFSSEELVKNINQSVSYDYELVLKELLFELSFTNKYDSDTRRRTNIYIKNDSSYLLTSFFDKFKIVCRDSTKVNEYSFVISYDEPKPFDFLKELPLLTVLNISIDNRTSSLKTIDLSPLTKIEHIGDNFLKKFSELESIDLSPLQNVKTIGNYFLSVCKHLKRIDLSPLQNVKTIGNNFLSGSGIESIDLLPLQKITHIGTYFLNSCNGLQDNIDLSPLINITSISDMFLSSCTNIKTIVFPETFKNITYIGAYFLSNLTDLRTIDLSYFSNVTNIDQYFLYGSKIKSIDLSPLKNLTSIEKGFMNDCKNLREVIFPETFKDVTDIDNYFFYESRIESINLSCFENVTNIGDYFLSNSGIKIIDLSPLKNLTSIEKNFMDYCKNLIEVVFPETFKHITQIDKNFLMGTSNLKTIDLSCFSNVTNINDNFLSNSGIENIDLSPLKNLTTVEKGFMSGCKNLTSVIVPSKLESVVGQYFTKEQIISEVATQQKKHTEKKSGEKVSNEKKSGEKVSNEKKSGEKVSNEKKSGEKKVENNCLIDPNSSNCTIMGGKRPKRYTKKIKRVLKRKTRKYK